MENSIKLSVKLYKYGTYNSIDIYEFTDKEHLDKWLIECEEYSNKVYLQSLNCGENLGKWEVLFELNNTSYWFDIDL